MHPSDSTAYLKSVFTHKRSTMPLLRSLAALVAGLTCCLLLHADGYAQAADYDLTIEPFTFEAADGRTVEAERGTFQVPENRQHDAGTRIKLAFVRFRSTNPNPGSPIVYLAGGPGGSGSGTARGSRFDLFMAFRDVADVIAFDQRGTGMSQRLPPCPKTWSYPLDQPGEREALLEAVIANARECAAHWKEQGVDLAAYTTRESADDLEALREALGVSAISLWSISYGTHLALATLKRHPGRIDRVIMAGLEGLDHTIKLPSDQQEMLEKIDFLVKEDPVMAQKLPDFLGVVEDVLDGLDREPVTVDVVDNESGETVSLTIGKYDVQLVSTSFLRGPSNFSGLLGLYLEMQQGDFSGVAPLVLQFGRSGSLRAMPTAMDAASGISDERRARVVQEREETLLGDAINFPFPEVAEGLGVPDAGPAFRENVETDVPALFISGTLDGRTPVHNAEEVRVGFSNSTHLIIDGAGHSDPLFLSSPRIAEVMLAFLKGEPSEDEIVTLPPPDLRLRNSITLDNATLEHYAGRYELAPDVLITIERAGGTLSVAVPGQGTATFYPETETVFFMKEADVQITFIEDEQGKVSEIVVNLEETEMRAARKD